MLQFSVLCFVAQPGLDFTILWTALLGVPSPWNSLGKNIGIGLPCLPPGKLPNLRKEPMSPTLQVNSLLPKSPGRPSITGVGSLYPIQGNFQTQESKTVSPVIAGGFFYQLLSCSGNPCSSLPFNNAKSSSQTNKKLIFLEILETQCNKSQEI